LSPRLPIRPRAEDDPHWAHVAGARGVLELRNTVGADQSLRPNLETAADY
jgi:hypothetical protein